MRRPFLACPVLFSPESANVEAAREPLWEAVRFSV
jgi:hypothetical protein